MRRLRRAAAAGAAALAALLLALVALFATGLTIVAMLALIVVAASLYARHYARLAGRAAVGARSEADVRRALAALEREGWRLRHSVNWRRADIDHVAVAPTGVAFAIETKTGRYEPRHLATVRAQAAWLERRRRRWARRGARPVLCLVWATGLQRTEHGVLLVSLDQLVTALRVAAGVTMRPGFLAVER